MNEIMNMDTTINRKIKLNGIINYVPSQLQSAVRGLFPVDPVYYNEEHRKVSIELARLREEIKQEKLGKYKY